MSLEQQAGLAVADMMKGLNDDVKIALKSAGTQMTSLVKADLQAHFKRSSHRASAAFFNAVKDYYVAPRGVLGHALYVRMGVPFIGIFEEGGTIAPGKFMVVRLPGAEQLHLPRIGKRNPLRKVLEDLARRKIPTFKHHETFFAKLGNRPVAIYQLRERVTEKKRLSFFAHAEAVAKQITLSRQ
jgi:hypothetical protein